MSITEHRGGVFSKLAYLYPVMARDLRAVGAHSMISTFGDRAMQHRHRPSLGLAHAVVSVMNQAALAAPPADVRASSHCPFRLLTKPQADQ